jgi:hypothetical protein
VTETTNTDNADLRCVRLCLWYPLVLQSYLLARSSTVVLQWRVDCDTTTEHRSCLGAVETVGDVEDEVTRVASIGSVTTITLAGSVLVLVAVCVGDVQAVILFTILAVLALAAAVRLSADTDYKTVSDADDRTESSVEIPLSPTLTCLMLLPTLTALPTISWPTQQARKSVSRS